MVAFLILAILVLALWSLNTLLDIHLSVLHLQKRADLVRRGGLVHHRDLFVDGLF